MQELVIVGTLVIDASGKTITGSDGAANNAGVNGIDTDTNAGATITITAGTIAGGTTAAGTGAGGIGINLDLASTLNGTGGTVNGGVGGAAASGATGGAGGVAILSNKA